MTTTFNISRHAFVLAALQFVALLRPAGVLRSQEPGSEPTYVRVSSGWLGLLGHGNEYARFPIIGHDVQLQDGYHVMIQPGLGLMITFAEKTDLTGSDLLSAHVRSEATYWRDHAAKVDTVRRRDLESGRNDVRVTELRLSSPSGDKMIIDMIGLRATDGVFAFGFSPAGTAATDSVVMRFVHTLEVVGRPLTAAEVARLSHSVNR